MNKQAIKYLETVARESVWPHVRQRAELKIVEIRGRQVRVTYKPSHKLRHALKSALPFLPLERRPY